LADAQWPVWPQALAMPGLRALAMPGLLVSANFGSEVRACSKTEPAAEHTLLQRKAQPWPHSQSLSTIFSSWITFLHQFKLSCILPPTRIGFSSATSAVNSRLKYHHLSA